MKRTAKENKQNKHPTTIKHNSTKNETVFTGTSQETYTAQLIQPLLLDALL